MTDPDKTYRVLTGGHRIPHPLLTQILLITEIEKKHNLNTETARRIWCTQCKKWVTVIFADETFTALSDCKEA